MSQPTVSKENQEYFLKDLRQRTAQSHQQLEENFYSKALLDQSVTLEDYQTYLYKLCGVSLACERDIFPALSSLSIDLDKRFKAHLIVNDLKTTGFTSEAISQIPVFNFSSGGIAQALGVMYVLEGSTLGGRILYKHINDSLDIGAEEGASYFWGYGAETGAMWKSFISVLSQYAIDHHCENEIVFSATETFTSIDQWLTKAEISLVK